MEINTDSTVTANPPPASARRRYLSGLLLGLMTGLVFGAVSGYVNHVLLRGVPYYQAPFGSFGNLLVAAIIGALVGLATSLPLQRGKGIFFGVITAAALGALRVFAQTWFFSTTADSYYTGFGFLFLLLCLVFTPLVLLLRLGIDSQAKYSDQLIIAWDRIRWPLVLGLIALVIGFFGVFSAREFDALTKTSDLIRQGQQASQPSALPADLSGDRVPSFWEHRNEPFQLLLIPREMTQGEGEIVVVVGFDSGWNMLCTFKADRSLRICEEP